MEIKCQLDATELFIAELTACSTCFGHHYAPVAYPGIFFQGGVQQIQLRTEVREDGDLGAVAP